MADYQTPQEAFWAGEFGNAYVQRNSSDELLGNKTALFARILKSAGRISSVIEFGANVGLNMLALRILVPAARLAAVEINSSAFDKLRTIPGVEAHLGSFLEFEPTLTSELSFTSGVLIHINPDHLQRAYSTLYQSSQRYVLVVEYYNPTPVTVTYRGQHDRLFKRDWAGDLMDLYPDLLLIDYGFVYHRDPAFPGDDLTWFLMEKSR